MRGIDLYDTVHRVVHGARERNTIYGESPLSGPFPVRYLHTPLNTHIRSLSFFLAVSQVPAPSISWARGQS